MNSKVVTVHPDDTTDHAISLMVDHKISGLPVVDSSGNLVGMISEFDLLELVFDCWTKKDRVCHYMSKQLFEVHEEDDWVDVADLLRSNRVRRVPITRDSRLVGIISRHDLLRSIRDARCLVRDVLSQQ